MCFRVREQGPLSQIYFAAADRTIATFEDIRAYVDGFTGHRRGCRFATPTNYRIMEELSPPGALAGFGARDRIRTIAV
jgi:hypothetical protein